MENVRNRLGLEFPKKDVYKKFIKQQSKVIFNGIQKSYENWDVYVFKKNEVLMDQPVYLGFAVLELSNLHKYETCFDKLQPYFGQENWQLHHFDTDAFVLSVKTKDDIKDLKILENIFDFSTLGENHDVFSNINKKVVGKFKIEAPKNVYIDQSVALRSKIYAFKCGIDSKNKLKGISESQSKHNNLEEYNNCLFGGEYQKVCDNYIIRSINHELYLQQLKKSTLSLFDVKRCYLNETESIPWN